MLLDQCPPDRIDQLRMKDFTVLDSLPNVVCILNNKDMKINFVNEQFGQQIASKNIALKQDFSAEYLVDHADRIKFASTVSIFETGTSKAPVSFGVMKTLTVTESGELPRVRNIMWALSYLDENNVIVSGTLMPSAQAGEADDIEISTQEADFIDYFQKAPIALHWLSGSGKVLWANDIELRTLGYSKEEYIGHHISEFCPDDHELLLGVFEKLGRDEEIHDVAFRFRTKSNTIKVFLIDSNVSWNTDGSFRHSRCFIRDITEENIKRAIDATALTAAKQYSAAKSNLLQMIFHTMRTPLHFCMTKLEFFRGKSSSVTEAGLTELYDSVSSLVDTVRDAACAANFEGGRVPTNQYSPQSVPNLLRDVQATIGNRDRRAGQKIKFHVSKTPSFMAHVEKTLLRLPCAIVRVLDHLVMNAVQHSPVQADVTIVADFTSTTVTTSTQQHLSISISNFSNCPTSTAEHLLSFCNNSHSSFSTTFSLSGDSQGMGMGLFLASNLLESMKSALDISVEPSADGKPPKVTCSFVIPCEVMAFKSHVAGVINQVFLLQTHASLLIIILCCS